MKILSITEKVPQTTTLPDGKYIIELQYKGKYYELKTEEGVRGIGFGVIVTIKNGEATFDSIDN